MFSLEKRRLQEDLMAPFSTYRELIRKILFIGILIRKNFLAGLVVIGQWVMVLNQKS